VGSNLSPAGAKFPGDPEKEALRAEIERLQRCVAELQAERDEYARQNAELFVLQQVFSTINSTLDINDILSMVLRGVREALGCGRVILFDVGEQGAIVRRLEADADGNVAPSRQPLDYLPDSTLQKVALGLAEMASGNASDPDKPLRDTAGGYCIAPLLARNVVRGILYADRAASGRISDYQLRILLDFASQAAVASENARLYDETRSLLEETQRLALTDPLTGIANRRAITEMLERELYASERYDTPFAFMILDLDDLKVINDSGGHNLGDLALKRFAGVLKKAARRGDIVGRYAGDEFVVVLSKTDRAAAERGVDRIFSALRRTGLHASIGVAMFPDDGTNAQMLFFAADEALYAAKQNGKNTYRFFGDRTQGIAPYARRGGRRVPPATDAVIP
jgi:diguanylate cyclase (GGDEF)-like protein